MPSECGCHEERTIDAEWIDCPSVRTVFELDPLAVLAFVAVAEHGSFRGASRVLAIPKSTLSQRVAALEAHLGAQLLVRTTRSVQLTDVGASYHREVAPAIESLRAAESTVAMLQAKPTGRLRMTAPYELGQYLLPDILAEYGQRYPDVVLDVQLADRLVNIVEEGFDLAIRVGPLADSGLVARRLGSPKSHGVYASRAYLKRHGTPKTPADLATHRCLVMSGGQTPTTWTFHATRARGATSHVQIRPILAVNSFDVLARLGREGLGIVAIPERLVLNGPEELLRRLLPAYQLPVRQSFAVYPTARNVSPALRALVDILVERLAGG